MKTKKPSNTKRTARAKIIKQMNAPRALPQGRKDFETWSDSIVSGALVEADVMSQKFALADLLLHLGPTESHKPDAFFIHSLRKFAVNQVAIEMKNEIKAQTEEKRKSEEAEAEAKKTPEQKASDKAAEATVRRIESAKAAK